MRSGPRELIRFNAIIALTALTAASITAINNSPKPASASVVISTPAFVQKAITASNTNSSTIAVAFSTQNTAIGDLIVAAVGFDSTSGTTWSCADSAGNSYTVAKTVNDTTKGQATGVCWAYATTAAKPTVTATLPASLCCRALAIQEYSGIASSNPVDVTAGQFGVATANVADAVTSTTATTTQANDLIFGVTQDDSSATASGYTAGTGFTQRGSGSLGNTNDFITQDKVAGSAGSYASTCKYTGAANFTAVMVAFKAASRVQADYVYGQGGSYTTSTAAATSTGLNVPDMNVVDSVHHRYFVADGGNNRVLVYTLNSSDAPSSATATNVLGQSTFTGSGTAATQSGMNDPEGLAYDSTNNQLFVSDIGNSRVLVFDVSSITNGENATHVLGQSTFTASTAGLTQARMSGPSAVEWDGTNSRLFVSDSGNNRVLIYNISTITDGMNAAYVLGQANFTTGTAALTQSGLHTPTGVSFDAATGYLYVSDQINSRVEVFNLSGTITNGMNATYALGKTNFTTSTQQTTQNGLNNPGAVDAKSNYIWVGDATNNRVVGYAKSSLATGMNATQLIGQANYTTLTAATTQTGFNGPWGVTYDLASGQLFVDDSGNSRSLVYTVDAVPTAPSSLAQYKSDGSTSITTGGTNDSTTTIFKGVVTGGNTGDTNKLCVEVQNVATAFTGTSTVCSSAVAQGATASVTVSGLVDGTSYHWQAYNVDTVNNVYSAWASYGGNSDTITAATDFAISVPTGPPANYVYGQGGSYTTATAATTSTGMTGPRGTAVDSVNHRLFVAESTNNRVLVFPLDSADAPASATASYVLGQSSFTTSGAATTQSGMSGPTGVAIDTSTNKLYVADTGNGRVLVFDTSTITNGMNASYVIGKSDYVTGTCGLTSTSICSPHAVAIDQTNHLIYVSDFTDNRIVTFDVSTLANGPTATHVLGQTNFTTSTAATTQGGLSGPSGIALDGPAKYLYVADSANNRIEIFNTTSITDGMNASFVLGQSAFTTSTAATTQSGLSGPKGVSVDTTNHNAYVADSANNRVIVFPTASLANGENANSMYGQGSYTLGGAATTQTGLSSPRAVSIDMASMRLFVADFTNNRVVIYYLDNAPTTPSSLAQYKSDGTTTLAVGTWNNSTTVVFKALTSDPDATDTNALCVEIQSVASAFVNTETACGSAVTQGGTATLTISTLVNGTQYHWQARTKDSLGVYSPWSSFAGNSDTVTAATDVGIDTTAPATGTVYDGSSVGVDGNYNTGSLSSLSANWSGFSDGGSGIALYEYSIGTSAGATDVVGWTSNTTSTSVTKSSLTLQTSQRYFFNIRATDAAGNVSSVVSSDGQLVAPTLTFSLGTTSLNFGHLNAGNSYTTTASNTVTTSTNAYGGYVVRQYNTSLLTAGTQTIPAYSGTYASPTTWSGTGFGYTSSDTSIQALGNLFTTGTKYAALTTAAPGDIVADHTSTVTGTPISAESFTLTYKLATTSNQAGGLYTNVIVIGATAIY